MGLKENMDWTTPLRSLQSDFIQRLKSGYLLHSELEGTHSELTVISGERLNQLRDFCWEMADKYKRNSHVRNVFINNMKGKLGKEVIKARLGDFATEVDYKKRIGGDEKVDFTLTDNPSVGIQVKARYGDINKVKWSISQAEVEKNAVLVCVLIQEQVSEAQAEYHLILAGFVPTDMIEVRHGKASFQIDELLYSGGLKSYLENCFKNKNILTNTSNHQLYFKRGMSHAKRGEFEEAIKDFTKAININPNDANFYFSRGMAYAEMGELEKAIENCTKAIKINPNDANFYFSRGFAYAESGYFEEAIKDFTKAIEINPTFTKAYFNRGVTYAESGYFEEAIKDFTKAIEVDPRLTDVYWLRGMARVEKGDFQGAIEDFTEVIGINPTDADAYNNRGLARVQRKDFEGAIEDYTKAIEINPTDADVYFNRALAHIQRKDFEGAIEDYTKAIKINSADADIYFNRGIACGERGDYQKAVEDYKKAADLYNQQGSEEWYQKTLELIKNTTDYILKLKQIRGNQ
ncbi:MAG: tetratricopeptide repeat protein [Halothece sp.]